MLSYLFLVAYSLAGILEVDILDVGQGDAIFIRSPQGKTVLIDGGTGRKGNIVAMLKARNVESLNLMVATHPHADHIGGLDEVLEAIPVKAYLDSGMSHTTRTYAKVMELVERKEIKYIEGKAGRVLRLDDGIELTILHPQDTLLRNSRSDLNSNSVVIRMTHKDNCFLFTGDAEEPTEDALVRKGLEPCNVLKVAHHGSNHSSTKHFLDAVQPDIALISLGAGNRYGHPGEESMARLKDTGAQIYRTDLMGTIKLTSDGTSVTVQGTKQDSAKRDEQKKMVLVENVEEKKEVSNTTIKVAPVAVITEGKFDINTATQSQLESINGIGPSKAQAILSFLTESGPVTTLDELTKIRGIGKKTVEKISDKAFVTP
jgi:competence ComEA-like helix-hairpin-helix protein